MLGYRFYFNLLASIICAIAIGAGLLINCDGKDDPGKGGRKTGALDKILVSEISDEQGSLYFPHLLHSSAKADKGLGIECETCHHDYKGPEAAPPQSCRKCHISHDQEAENVNEFL
ncbi:cytochrome c3 family protein [Planctomycetota bacterium]